MKNAILFALLCGCAITLLAQSGPGHALFIAGNINDVAFPHTASFNSPPITVTAWFNTSVTIGQQGLINKYAAKGALHPEHL